MNKISYFFNLFLIKKENFKNKYIKIIIYLGIFCTPVFWRISVYILNIYYRSLRIRDGKISGGLHRNIASLKIYPCNIDASNEEIRCFSEHWGPRIDVLTNIEDLGSKFLRTTMDIEANTENNNSQNLLQHHMNNEPKEFWSWRLKN